MNAFKAETVKQRKIIYQLEKERERYGVEDGGGCACTLS